MAKSGFYKNGKSHEDGGIPVLVDGSKEIEVELHEYKLCNNAIESTKIFEFKDKTNKEILDEIFEYANCEFKQNEANSGDFIICKLAVLDKKKRNITGTAKEIINVMQSEKSCNVTNDSKEFKDGGEINKGYEAKYDNDETYTKWKNLVNMSKSELENFYNSKDGKEAGLSSSEAKEQGISSGRESARWIIKMKDTPKSEWTPTMWKWANKQISFISRMSGMKGDLYDDKGNKTRKHTSLLIWGHNPKKYNNGGELKTNEMENKENKTHTYALTLRPFDIGTYPKENFIRFVEDEKYPHGLIEYSKPIPLEKIKHYSLSPITEINEFDGKEFTYYEDLKAKAQIVKNNSNIPYVKVTMFDENNEVSDEATMDAVNFMENVEKGRYKIIGDLQEINVIEKPIVGNVFADIVLNRLEIIFKKRFPNDKFEREAFIDIWNKTKNERDTDRANNNLAEIYLSYFDNDLKSIIYSDILKEVKELEKGIAIESEHKNTAEKLYKHEIKPEQAAESIAKEHLAESKNYYKELEKMEEKLKNTKDGNNNLTDSKISLKVEDYKNPFLINKAIEKLIDLKANDRYNYDINELNFISYYSGYGGLGKYGEVGKELAKGLKYEFYTPDEVVKKMWGLAYKYGYGTIGDNSVMETSAGIGNFVKYAPKDVKVVCNEINKYSAKILEILYPHAIVYNKYFEQNFITKDNKSMKNKIDSLDKYSLIIGNPPYGELTGKYIGMGEDNYTKASNFCEYFITRSLDLLIQDGLLIYIVGAEQLNGGTLFLDSKLSKVKEIIFDKAHLIDAYRLPVKIFERTGVSSEILIFRKK